MSAAALIAASRGGQVAQVEALLDQGVNVDALRLGDSWTALMSASNNGHRAVIQLLLDRGANANVSFHMWSPLSIAARHGRLDVLELLVERGADVNQMNGGYNALMLASMYNHVEACEALLARGADLLAVDPAGRNSLALYGSDVPQHLNPEALALCRARLEEAWRAGPHPSQVQRRKDEAWAHRKALLMVLATYGYRPLAYRVAAMPAVDPAAAIPAIPLDIAEQRHAHLLGQVLSNEGVSRLLVMMQ